MKWFTSLRERRWIKKNDMVRVVVTQELIDNGHRGKCYRCPIAFAIKQAAKLPREIIVRVPQPDHFTVVNLDRNKRRTVPLPGVVAKKILVFDQVGIMEPFSFFITQKRIKEIL